MYIHLYSYVSLYLAVPLLSTLWLSQYYTLSTYCMYLCIWLFPLLPALWLSQYYNLSAYVSLYLAVPSYPHSGCLDIILWSFGSQPAIC
jgi:hypothetical protein